MQNDLLWVYEGLTDYYGNVLTARSGLRTPEQARDEIALIAANFEISPGRTWRSLVDTTNQPIISAHGALAGDLAKLAAFLRLLLRIRPHLARCRHQDPRAERRTRSRSTILPSSSLAWTTAVTSPGPTPSTTSFRR